jgi:Zn-dependent M28 family amino/carboxypeptidase
MRRFAPQFASLAALALLAAAAQAQPAAGPTAMQDPLVATAEQLRDRALAGSGAYAIVESLTTEIGPRPAGSPAMDRANDWAVARLTALGFENVRTQEYPISGWVRGQERAEVVGSNAQPLILTTLVGSVATPARGLEAEMVLFRTYDDLLVAPADSLKGKIAVVTQAMTTTQDGSGYGAAGPVRRSGASEAARRGAVAYLHRSLGTHSHRFPHTGSMSYAEGAPKIPAAALSPPDAEQLERLAARGPVRLRVTLTPSERRNARAKNIIAEVRGRERPDELVVIGAHLDAWDLGTGAVDDGAGVAIVTAAAKLVRDLPQRPRRTIRVVLFGAEEIGEAGPAYAKAHAAEIANHVVVSESDFGADRIYGLALPAGSAQAPAMQALRRVLVPLGVNLAAQPATNGGPDFAPLQPLGVPAVRLQQDGTSYFNFHHTADDTLDKIDREALDQNVAAWAAFLWTTADSDVDFRAAAAAR